jgi:hypothetical protein
LERILAGSGHHQASTIMARTRSREIDAVDECVPGRRLACWPSEIEEEDWGWVRMDGVGSMTLKMRQVR